MLVRHNSRATVVEQLAQNMSLAGVSVIGYVYLQVTRRPSLRARQTTVRGWFEATASPALRHHELVDTE